METSNKKRLTIAIDGPSGAGKSTAAKALARRLGYVVIDTGAMYRSVALRIKEESISPEDERAVKQLASSLHITFIIEGERTLISCDGKDMTDLIRTPEISRLASTISKQEEVRKVLVKRQREMGKTVARWREVADYIAGECEECGSVVLKVRNDSNRFAWVICEDCNHWQRVPFCDEVETDGELDEKKLEAWKWR